MYSWFAVVVALQIVGRTDANILTLTNKTGDIVCHAGDNASYHIILPKHFKIIVSINQLNLSSDGYLKLRDGSQGTIRRFQRCGFGIYETDESCQIPEDGKAISLPIVMNTTTRKLNIYHGNETEFNAHYTSYKEGEGCQKKDNLTEEDGITAMDCDVDPLSPFASQCNVTLACEANYTQQNKSIVCQDGEWEGRYECGPKKELVDHCVFYFENETAANVTAQNTTERNSSSCLYTPLEVARYYIYTEGVDVSTSGEELGRALQLDVVCDNVCRVNRNGKYAFACNRARGRKLTDETGDIISSSGEKASYIIRVAKRSRIVISVNSVSLSDRGYLKLRDGVSGEERTFKRFGFGIYETTSSGRISGDVVLLPIKMTTLTRKLFVQYHNEDGDGLSAHYTSYNEEQGCWKDQISMEAGGREITTVNCDADELSPLASECVVTVSCAPTHVQYNDLITCHNGDWTGKFDCKPRQDLIDDCVFDFNNLNENEPNSCPYTPEEIAHYYIDVKDVIISTSQALGRSTQTEVKCGNVCKVYGNANYAVDCNNPRSNKQRVRCYICRLVYKCKHRVVFF